MSVLAHSCDVISGGARAQNVGIVPYHPRAARSHRPGRRFWLEQGDSPLAFFRVLRVMAGGRDERGRRALRVGAPIAGGAARQQLWGTSGGVFLAGATDAEARRWAEQQAARYGAIVLPPERHGQGRPHLHIGVGPNVRSGHIFWGTAPPGTFFDYDY